MDPSKLPPMKSGFQMFDDSKDDEFMENFSTRLESILQVLMKKAIITAAEYSTKSGRESIVGQDMIYALQYQTHEFGLQPDIEQEILAMENDSESEYESESEEEEYEDDDSIEIDEPFQRATDISDEFVNKMNAYHDGWNEWEPSDPIQKILKDSVNHTIAEYSV